MKIIAKIELLNTHEWGICFESESKKKEELDKIKKEIKQFCDKLGVDVMYKINR